MSELTQALEARKATPQEATVFQLIERSLPELAKALPQQMDATRFARVVWTEVRRTPKLLDCTPSSLLGAMLLSAQLGLEPGPLGQVYLVPFKGQVEFIIGYKGMVALAYRSGEVKDVATGIVYEGDAFEYREGTRPFLDHTPSGPPGERDWTHAYAVARLKLGGAPFRVIFPEDAEKAKARSAAGAKGSGPWVTDYMAMVRKTAVRRLAPMLPQSPAFAHGIERDETLAPEFDAEPFDLAALPESESEE